MYELPAAARREAGPTMRTVGVILLVAVWATVYSAPAAAAEPMAPERVRLEAAAAVDRTVSVTTIGRGSFQGRLLAALDDRLELITADGQIIQIAVSEIASLQALEPGAGRAALYQDAAANRLVVMPTGFPMRRGELHVTDQEILVVTSSYGLTDSVTLWGGISIPGLVLSARVSYPAGDAVGLSAGSFVGAEWFDFNTLVLPYALASFGSPNRNVTLGGGPFFGFIRGGEDPVFEGGVLALGGRTVLTPTAALVFESWCLWFADWRTALFTPAAVFRIAGSRLSWDLGAVVPLRLDLDEDPAELGGVFDGTVVPIPLVSLTYRID